MNTWNTFWFWLGMARDDLNDEIHKARMVNASGYGFQPLINDRVDAVIHHWNNTMVESK